MNNKKGFTLIELIIVLSIMAIISAIAIPKFSNIIDSQKEKACIVNREIIMEHYYFQKCLDESITLGAILDNSEIYFKEEVSCPSGGTYSVSNGAIVCNIHDDIQPDDEEGDEGDDQYAAWESGNKYKKGDLVSRDGHNFYARDNINGDVPGDVGAHWQEITSEWRNFNKYKKNDSVIYNNNNFIAKNNINPNPNHPGGTPDATSCKWQEITDEWRNFNSYKKNDEVKYNGNQYKAKQNITPNVNDLGKAPGTNRAPWIKIN